MLLGIGIFVFFVWSWLIVGFVIECVVWLVLYVGVFYDVDDEFGDVFCVVVDLFDCFCDE